FGHQAPHQLAYRNFPISHGRVVVVQRRKTQCVERLGELPVAMQDSSGDSKPLQLSLDEGLPQLDAAVPPAGVEPLPDLAPVPGGHHEAEPVLTWPMTGTGKNLHNVAVV